MTGRYKRAVSIAGANLFLRYSRCTVLVTMALAGWACFMALNAGVGVDAEVDDLLAGDQRNAEGYAALEAIIGEQSPIVVSVDCGEVCSPEGIALLQEVNHALGTIPGGTTSRTNITATTTNVVTVTNTSSVLNGIRPVITRRFPLPQMKWVYLLPQGGADINASHMPALRRWTQEHPLARNILVSDSGRHALIMAYLDRNTTRPSDQAALAAELEAALAPVQKKTDVRVFGLPLIEHEIRSTVMTDLRRFVPAALAVLLVVLAVTFRRAPRLIGYVLTNQLLGLILLPGLFYLTGIRLNIFTILLVPLLSAVHLTLLIHVGTAFQRAWESGRVGMEAAAAARAEVFRASSIAALTTAVGLLALLANEVPQMQDFGKLGAAGIVMFYAVTFGPGLAWLVVWFPDRGTGPAGQSGSFADRAFVRCQRLDVVTCVFMAGMLIAIGVGQVRTDVRASEFLNYESPTRQMIEQMDADYGGINLVTVRVDSGQTNGIVTPGFLKFLDEVHQHAEEQPGVTGVFSYAQLLRMINDVWQGGDKAALELPKSPAQRTLFASLINSQMKQLPFLSMITDTNFQTAKLTLRTKDMPSSAYLQLLRDVESNARERAPESITVSADNGLRSILEADARIVRSQRSSVLWCAAVIWLLLAVLWRSAGLATVALLVNALPVGLVLALQGYAGVPLNSVTIMVAAISLGIAVDDTIHFITQWRAERASGADAAAAARAAWGVKGRPIVVTTLILTGMLGVFWVSGFPPVVHFGLLLAAGLAGALLAALGLLPAWLSTRDSEAHK